jgi:SAM-dependent methyltransferase
MNRYDRTGRTYSLTRRRDPRIAGHIDRALHGTRSVANIGAGTGSYEPPDTVIAVEPSPVMIAQRPPGAAPAVQAVAEQLPIGTNTVDAALAVLTIHHWADLDHGIGEMVRIARHRVVIFTWDDAVFQQFWLLKEYLPAAAETDARLAIPLTRVAELLDNPAVLPVSVPHDCIDGFGGAYWRRPHAYLDPTVQAGMSMLALTPEAQLHDGLSRLRTDLSSGEWNNRHADLLNEPYLDLGYRLLIANTPENRPAPSL